MSYKQITTLEEAIKQQKDPVQLPDLSALPARFARGMIALLSLQIIIETVNNDDPEKPAWKPDYNNANQKKWYPWYTGGDEKGSGFSFYDTDCVWSYSIANGGARLALKDEARAEHMNEHFQGLYKELYLVLE